MAPVRLFQGPKRETRDLKLCVRIDLDTDHYKLQFIIIYYK